MGGAPSRARQWTLVAAAVVTCAALLMPAAAATTWTAAPTGEAACVEGQSRQATLYQQSFESGITEPRFASGFTRSSASGSARGSWAARASRPGSGAPAHFFLPYVSGTSGQNTRIAFAHRGNAATARNVVAVNSFSTTFPVTSQWRGASFDITAATRDEAGWLGTWFQHNVTPGSSTYLAIDNVQIFTCRPNATERIGGANRYATAALIAHRFAPGVPTAYLARGDDYPDALSGSALAAAGTSPVLLTETHTIPAETQAALQHLRPQQIVVLGGESSVSAAVETALGSYAPLVRRLGGSDRYETSALVAGEFPEGVPVAFLATGSTFADAMSGGGLAGQRGGPLLLTPRTSLPERIAAELERLRPSQIVILGGESAISPAVLAEARQYAPTVRRIAGPDRYATAALIAAEYPTTVPHTYLATGAQFPDGLTAGALAGSEGVPLLIAQPTSLPASVTTRLQSIQEQRGYVLGAEGALSSLVRDQYGRTLP